MLLVHSQLASSLGAGVGGHSPAPPASSSHVGGSASGSTSPDGSTDGLLEVYDIVSPDQTITGTLQHQLQ